MLWIHKGYCVVKWLVWNVRIKAFWFTNIFAYLLTIYVCIMYIIIIYVQLRDSDLPNCRQIFPCSNAQFEQCISLVQESYYLTHFWKNFRFVISNFIAFSGGSIQMSRILPGTIWRTTSWNKILMLINVYFTLLYTLIFLDFGTYWWYPVV